MNYQYFLILVFILILQRLSELYLSSRNEKILRQKKAIETGDAHYNWMILLHVLWFASLMIEAKLNGKAFTLDITLVLMTLILLCQVIRFWCMQTLKENWTTKILVIPGAELIKHGPYRFFNHPNYAVVVLEFILVPLIFQCYFTMVIFSLLNIELLKRRIVIENNALRSPA